MTALRDHNLITSSWVDLAACKGKDTKLWFSADRFGEAVAIAICRRCPVRQPCLEAALAEEVSAMSVYGVRGGLTPGQRVSVRRGRRLVRSG